VLVGGAYDDAKGRIAEQKAQRAEKKAAKREELGDRRLLHRHRADGSQPSDAPDKEVT
jgi:hypothetical protein